MRHGIGLMAAAMAAVCGAIAGLTAGSAHAGITCRPSCAVEKRVALVIGNSDYRHTRVLPNPRNDAQAVAGLLRGIGFTEADVALKIDLDYRAMREELRAFAGRAAGADVAIVYYAGHGIEVGGENYLVPVDARLASDRDLEWEAVSLASVLNVVGDARKLKLVILDACRNNPLSDKIALRGGVTREATRGLTRIEPKGDLLVAYAAKAGTVALDGNGRHSPYAEALIKHMATPGIDVFRMFGRVAEAVLDATGRRQEPWLYGRPGGDAVALVPGAQPPPVVRPSEAAETARICREVEGMSNPATLAVLERQHQGTPAGECVAARLAQLNTAAAVAPKPEPPPKVVEPAAAVTPDAALTPGRTFRDCAECPEMVVVPAGSFTMGSALSEIVALKKQYSDNKWHDHGLENEGPQRVVTIARLFAAGKYEVTFDEWDACVAGGACTHRPDARDGRGKQPVVNVSWKDITQQYLPWLSRKTGKTYRLLSEAEWEYAARAGTMTRFTFGETISQREASLGRPLAVGLFQPNAFGLYDMHGNVWEWVQDCWNASYRRAPSDGSAWTTGDCTLRVLRGGSYIDTPGDLRSANRHKDSAARRDSNLGFRVARSLLDKAPAPRPDASEYSKKIWPLGTIPQGVTVNSDTPHGQLSCTTGGPSTRLCSWR